MPPPKPEVAAKTTETQVSKTKAKRLLRSLARNLTFRSRKGLETNDENDENGIRPENSPSRTLYTYKPLPRGDFVRYLVLRPGNGNAPLECGLHVSRLKKMPFFEAISYVWGEQTREHDIRCDGCTLKITTNLQAALRRMRHPTRARKLWADSICIDQESTTEKNHQVALMSQIFSKASRTLIFLGSNHDGHADVAADLISEVNAMILRTFETIDFSWNSFPWPDAEEPILVDPRWKSVSILFKQQWFRRGWVVQEAAVAQEAHVFWGERDISWEELMRVYSWIWRRAHRCGDAFHIWPNDVFVDLYKTKSQNETKSLFAERDWFLASLLEHLHSAKPLGLTEPRDRIYAFMGLPLGPLEKRLHMQPDYEKPLSVVYIDFAQNYLLASENLDLLHYIQHTDESIDDGNASWVPRWDIIENMNTLWHPAGERLLPKDCPVGDAKFIPLEMNQSGLRVQAVIFDSICYVSDKLGYHGTSTETIADLWQTLCETGLTAPYPDTLQLEAFIQTLTTGINFGDMNTWMQLSAAYGLAISRADQKSCSAKASSLPGYSSRASNGDTEFIHGIITDYVDKRRIIQSERGYFGLAPGVACKGDLSCIIFGCRVPFVLRRTEREGYYKILGPIYMPGKHDYIDESGETGFDKFGTEDSKEWVEWGLEEEEIWLC
ncbi:heterokaryon incompatibility protein-domain-containing protein [Clohesyomyces aquaticus]|uniref:Heterokaryon incompatibility protein-domain-containing protein n=1 Tax=Clohesyomyces aquaticus TaxID=1231657 RepID=A0A1Y1Z809_9PLEO|nr:heterokaryon incompatibility protein-domain-containing protein [Clohesyomyces aquaticus]